jgi:group I intron endonuclease
MKNYSNEIKPKQIFTYLHIKANLEVCRNQLKGKSGIYGLKNLLNNQLYIGESINIYNRYKQHINHSHNFPLRNAIEKDGLHNFAFLVFVFVPSSSREKMGNQDKIDLKKELFRLETEIIKGFDPKFLYNIIIRTLKN